MTARNRALKVVELVQAKKGSEVLLLDLRRAALFADFFVICTAQSPLHAQAIADEVVLKLKQQNVVPDHVEGMEFGQWVLLDYLDVVVHIFVPEVRRFYGLERLWGDMPQRRFSDTPAG